MRWPTNWVATPRPAFSDSTASHGAAEVGTLSPRADVPASGTMGIWGFAVRG